MELDSDGSGGRWGSSVDTAAVFLLFASRPPRMPLIRFHSQVWSFGLSWTLWAPRKLLWLNWSVTSQLLSARSIIIFVIRKACFLPHPHPYPTILHLGIFSMSNLPTTVLPSLGLVWVTYCDWCALSLLPGWYSQAVSHGSCFLDQPLCHCRCPCSLTGSDGLRARLSGQES